MNVRLPRLLVRNVPDNPLAALEHEMLQEKVATLSRLGRRLEQALARLARYEQEASGHGEPDPRGREARLAEAGEALWHFVIQREAMGLKGTEQALKAYGVPPAVRLRMGASPRRR